MEGYKLPLQAIHPITKQPLSVFVSNYILADYGAGAVMGVPAHDERDAAFAAKYGLPSISVINSETHRLEQSGIFTGMLNE